MSGTNAKFAKILNLFCRIAFSYRKDQNGFIDLVTLHARIFIFERRAVKYLEILSRLLDTLLHHSR